MLRQIFDVLQNLFSLVSRLGEFAVDLMSDLLDLVDMLLVVANSAPQWFGFMPRFAFSAFTLIFAAVIVLRVAGRE